MPFEESKVYFDGSHYIAIPHTTRKTKKRRKAPKEEIIIKEEKVVKNDDILDDFDVENEGEVNEEIEHKERTKTIEVERVLTKKEYFEELYAEHWNLPRKERKKLIIEKMIPLFENEEECTIFVNANIERKQRNLVCRRVRLSRKTYLANFNYFCTFTYDNAKHTEESFRQKLTDTFKKLVYRKGWKYEGVWERSPEKNRLHFHGLFEIPEGTMPGEFITVKDYSPIKDRVQVTNQSTYFNERFGRTTFEELDPQTIGPAIAYLVKYIEKTGEKIVYSKNLPQYFISDIMDDDVVCRIGQEEKKLLLSDDFTCWDEGCYIGQVSPEVIKQMRKAN